MAIIPALAERARAGSALTAAELEDLAASDVLSLGMLADERRRASAGDTVTYIRVHDVSLALEPVPPGAGEVRITSLPETREGTVEAVKAARRIASGRLLTGFSLADLAARADAWGGLGRLLAELKTAGLDAITEMPVDQLADAAAALQACADAGLAVRCLSIAHPVREARSTLLLRVRALVDRFPALRTFAPLPRTQSTASPTTGYDDVRAVAMARLALPALARVQVDWAQYGPKLAQVALTFGANDVDRVSAVDDESLGRRRTAVEDVKRNIAAAGFTPVERDAAR